MPHPDPLTEALYGDHRGEARPFVPGVAVFDALEAVRGDDGVWVVLEFAEEEGPPCATAAT